MSGDFDYTVDRAAEIPLGTQLAWKIRASIESGHLGRGERLPSVRTLADLADVNVNTVRAVYGRLEEQGLVASEQGRGTFVADPEAVTPEQGGEPAAAPDRAVLRQEIERLEGELARRPQLPSAPDPGVFEGKRRAGASRAGGLLSAAELKRVRDSLLERLGEIEDARSEVMRTLERLEQAERAEAADAEREPERRAKAPRGSRSASTLGPVRVRWVGGA